MKHSRFAPWRSCWLPLWLLVAAGNGLLAQTTQQFVEFSTDPSRQVSLFSGIINGAGNEIHVGRITDPGNNGSSVFLAELTTTGTVVRSLDFRLTGTGIGTGIPIRHATATGVVQVPDGGYVLCGYTNTSTNNDSLTTRDIFAMKITATGNLVWQNLRGRVNERDEPLNPHPIAVAPDGSVVITGWWGYNSQTDQSSPFIERLNHVTGTGIWSLDKTRGGLLSIWYRDVAIADSFIVAVGGATDNVNGTAGDALLQVLRLTDGRRIIDLNHEFDRLAGSTDRSDLYSSILPLPTETILNTTRYPFIVSGHSRTNATNGIDVVLSRFVLVRDNTTGAVSLLNDWTRRLSGQNANDFERDGDLIRLTNGDVAHICQTRSFPNPSSTNWKVLGTGINPVTGASTGVSYLYGNGSDSRSFQYICRSNAPVSRVACGGIFNTTRGFRLLQDINSPADSTCTSSMVEPTNEPNAVTHIPITEPEPIGLIPVAIGAQRSEPEIRLAGLCCPPEGLSVGITSSVPTTVCSGTKAVLTASGATTYVWQPGNLQGSSISRDITANTTFTVTGTTAQGCTGSATISFTVATPSVSANNPTVCGGQTAQLTATATGFSPQDSTLQYTWQPGNLSGATVTVNPTPPAFSFGNYTRTYTVTVSNGTCTATATAVVSVQRPAFSPNPIFRPFELICSAGGSASLSVGLLQPIAGTTFSWAPATGLNTTTGASVIASPSQTTTYTITATTPAGCTATTTRQVRVANFSLIPQPNQQICSGDSASVAVVVNPSSLPGISTSYTWFPSAGIISQFDTEAGSNVTIIPPPTTITYTIVARRVYSTFIGVPILTCSSSDTITVVVQPAPSFSDTVAWCPGDSSGCLRVPPGLELLDPSSFEPLAGCRPVYSAGVYNYLVRNTEGCVGPATFVVLGQSSPLEFTHTSVYPSSGQANGSIDLTVSGGFPPYAYSWSNGQSTEDLANLAAGQYTVQVSDRFGCSATFSIYLGCPYSLVTDSTLRCGSTFDVCLVANVAPTPGTIGINFSLKYDPTAVLPVAMTNPNAGGTLGPVVLSSVGFDQNQADYYLNKYQPGVIHAAIAYSPSAPPASAALTGTGQVLCIRFEVQPGAVAGNWTKFFMEDHHLIESYETGHQFVCVDSTWATFVPGSRLASRVIYRNEASKPLMDDNPNNSLPYNETRIEVADANCQPTGQATFTDLNGEFVLDPVLPSHQIRISRFTDDALCPSVSGVLSGSDPIFASNGYDAYLATLITTKDVTAIPNFANNIPTAYDMIAADANQDGLVLAADVTLIQQRSAGTRCFFPGGRDWAFLSDELLASAPYQPSASYPNDDQSGFSRFRVPIVPLCLNLPSYQGTTCPTLSDSIQYHAVYIGDVDGNWSNSTGAQLRTSAKHKAMADLTGLTPVDGWYHIPLVVESATKAVSFDLVLYAGSGLEFGDVQTTAHAPQDVMLMHHRPNAHALRLTSYSVKGFESSGMLPVYELRVKAATPAELNELQNAAVFINGDKTSLTVLNRSTTGVAALQHSPALALYPNPTSGSLTLQFQGLAPATEALQVLDVAGRVVQTQTVHAVEGRNEVALDLSAQPAGVYFVQALGQTAKVVLAK